jgi:hypothetical protein
MRTKPGPETKKKKKKTTPYTKKAIISVKRRKPSPQAKKCFPGATPPRFVGSASGPVDARIRGQFAARRRTILPGTSITPVRSQSSRFPSEFRGLAINYFVFWMNFDQVCVAMRLSFALSQMLCQFSTHKVELEV